jgi:hypothetical protein
MRRTSKSKDYPRVFDAKERECLKLNLESKKERRKIKTFLS